MTKTNHHSMYPTFYMPPYIVAARGKLIYDISPTAVLTTSVYAVWDVDKEGYSKHFKWEISVEVL